MPPTIDTSLAKWHAALAEARITELPTPLQHALDVRDALHDRFVQAQGTPRQVAEEAVDAMLNGHGVDAALDATAAKLWTHHASQELQRSGVENIIGARLRRLMTEHQGAVYAQIAPQVHKETKRLEKAARQLPDDLSPDSVLSADAGPAWTAATDSAGRLSTLARIAEPVHTTRMGTRDVSHWIYLVDLPDAEVIHTMTPVDDPRHVQRRAHHRTANLLGARGRKFEEGLIRIARGEAEGVRINVTTDPGVIAERAARHYRATHARGNSMSMA